MVDNQHELHEALDYFAHALLGLFVGQAARARRQVIDRVLGI
jgi:hypothetical protein